MIRILDLHNSREVENFFRKLHVDETGIKIMLPKTSHHLIYIDSLNVPAANILKQELLSLGGDVVLHKGACNFSVQETPCVLIGTKAHYHRLAKKLSAQPFGLKKLAVELKQIFEKFEVVPPSICIGGTMFHFSKSPFIMGIINVTPDSFSGDGIYQNVDEALRKAEQLIEQGAHILDIGGESTRPGAQSIPLDEEKSRVIPVVKAVAKSFRIPVSIDTSKARIAEEALHCGAHLVNDVTGLTGDPKMASVIKKTKAPAVIMHHRFPSKKTQDVIGEVCRFFKDRIDALQSQGISSSGLILDPGIGFGKTAEQNLLILKQAEEFKVFGKPLLLGTSRKSFIGKVLKNEAHERLIGTLASLVFGQLKGFHFFRVHDVSEARQALLLSQAILNAHE